MIHELIEPKKKTNKTISSRNTKTFQDNKPFSEHFAFELSDSENKEAESSSTTTFIPPWLRNSLGLNQRNNQSHAAAGHSDQKSPKIIQRYKGPSQNEFEPLKANVEGDCCKKATDQFETLSSCCPQEESIPASTDEVSNTGDKTLPVHWRVKHKESNTDSSCVNTEMKPFEKEDSITKSSDMVTVPEMGKLKDEEKKKAKFIRQKSKVRKRSVPDQRALELSKDDAECLLEMKTSRHPEQTVEMKELETKLMLLGRKARNADNAVVNSQELRLLQDMKEEVGRIGDFDQLLEQVKEVNLRELIKNPDFLTENIGDKKVHCKEDRSGREMTQSYNDDGKSNADKDSLLSTDDENDIKRFSEFLSKNKNTDEKRKCLEEVRNYFEKKRRTRLSRRRYLEDIKSKLAPEMEKKEEHERKDKPKCKELFTIMPNRGRKSKFALCDEEVVEKAVDETLQKFVELYHFHVSPKVMGDMKKNILQAMQSDSIDSSCSKLNLVEAEDKPEEEKDKSDVLKSEGREHQKGPLRSFLSQQAGNPEVPSGPAEMPVHKEMKKKTFKTLIISSNERLQKHPKESDVVENERLKRLNREFENFLHSIRGHIEVSNLKIQSIIFEKEEHGSPSKNGQFIYNFTKKALEAERTGHWEALRETQEPRTYKEVGVQALLKKEPLKKSVRIQVMDHHKTFEQGSQTEEKTYTSQITQTESGSVLLRELKELKSTEINPGLYRMVKSREAGKFYLYPEQMENGKEQVYEKNNSGALKDKKSKRRRELLDILSKERTKERRVYFREREKGKLKRSRRPVYAVAHLKATANKREKLSGDGSGSGGEVTKEENSLNCLYFRNLDGKNSESQQSRKEESSKKTSAAEAEENLGLGDAKEVEHLGCVWFWNGKKISPGCDLKTHVEDLLKEKLREIADLNDPAQIKTLANELSLAKDNGGVGPEGKGSQKNVKKNPSTVFCFRTFTDTQKESSVALANEIGNLEATTKTEGKIMEEREEVVSQEKIVRSVATQNSQQTVLSFNLTKTKTQSKTAISTTKKKHSKQPTVLKPTRKLLNFKKAEEIIRAVEEIKNLKRELEGSRRDSESLLAISSSSTSSKNDIEDSLSLVLGLRDGQKSDHLPNSNPKHRLKKIIGFTNHEVQTTDPCDPEDSEDSRTVDPATDSHKHLDLIENVLCRVNQKERENLWNDVREFIKSKIGRDINDDGAREVCIEIEQDMPKHEHGMNVGSSRRGGYSFLNWVPTPGLGNFSGTVKQAVMARGHYVRNEGDVEVEIDLTLDDLEKILRQRHRRIRRQHASRKKSKRFISSSSFQSDLTRDEVRKCQKYLNRFTTLGEGFLKEEPSGSPKKSKGN